MTFVKLLLFPFLLYLPGLAIYVAAFGNRRRWGGTPAEALFIQFACASLYVGGVGYLLAEMGLFSLWLLLGLCVVPSLALLYAYRRRLQAMWRVERTPPHPQPLPREGGGESRTPKSKIANSRTELIALAVILLVAGFLFMRPAELIRGTLDAGVYANTGAHIAQRGSVLVRDPILLNMSDLEIRQYFQGLNPARFSLTRLRFPGFYIFDKNDRQGIALVDPQHYSLYPVWLAIFYAVGDMRGEFFATPYLMLLALLAVYFAGRRMFGFWTAIIGVSLLAVNTTEVWFARYPVSETLRQFLGFTAFYAFAMFVSLQRRGMRHEARGMRGEAGNVGVRLTAPNIPANGLPADAGRDKSRPYENVTRAFAVMAAVALGQIAWTHPEFLFYLLPVPLYVGYLMFTRGWRSIHKWLFVPLLLMLAVAVLHIFFYTYPYTSDLFFAIIQGLRRQSSRIFQLLYIGGGLLGLAVVLWRWGRLRAWRRRLTGLWRRGRRWALLAVSLVAGAALVYAYLIRPNIFGELQQIVTQPGQSAYIGAPLPLDKMNFDDGIPHDPQFNLVKLGWYFSPLGILLATGGLMLAIYRRLRLRSIFFFLMLAITLVIFVGQSYTDPHYIYTARRYIPIIVPGFSLMIGFFIYSLWQAIPVGVRSITPNTPTTRPAARASFTAPSVVGRAGRDSSRRSIFGWPLRVVAGISYLVMLTFFVYTLQNIVWHTEAGGAIEQIDGLNAQLPPRSVLLFSGQWAQDAVVSTPLKFYYGHDALGLAQVPAQIDKLVIQNSIYCWLAQPEKITNPDPKIEEIDRERCKQRTPRTIRLLLGGDGGKLNLPDFDYKPLAEWVYQVPELQQRYADKPLNVTDSSRLRYGIYELVPAGTIPRSLPLIVDLGGSFDYEYQVQGWSGQERDNAGVTFRWVDGTDIAANQPPRTSLRLPVPTDTTQITITMRVSPGPALRDTPAALRLLAADGTAVISQTLPLTPPGGDPATATFYEVSGRLQLPADHPRWVELRLAAAPWQPTDDPRRLGVQVDWIRMEGR